MKEEVRVVLCCVALMLGSAAVADEEVVDDVPAKVEQEREQEAADKEPSGEMESNPQQESDDEDQEFERLDLKSTIKSNSNVSFPQDI